MHDPRVLVVAVAYESPGHVRRLLGSFQAADTDEVEVVIADNSPTADEVARTLSAGHARAHYLHFPHNPYYSGAARAAVLELVAARGRPLAHHGVVLCNVDLHFDWTALVRLVAAAERIHDGTRWMLAPDIHESGKRWRANPFALEPQRSRRRHWFLRRSSLLFRVYWALSLIRRRFFENPHCDAEPWTPIHAPYGGFIVFGAEWFRAGGVFHEAPLFNEEEAFGAMSAHIGAPVLWAPDLRVDHESGASYRRIRGVGRRRYEWHRRAEEFYDTWDPSEVAGEMADCFVETTE